MIGCCWEGFPEQAQACGIRASQGGKLVCWLYPSGSTWSYDFSLATSNPFASNDLHSEFLPYLVDSNSFPHDTFVNTSDTF